MNISPHHLAAALYSIIAVFSIAVWCYLLIPADLAASQLDSMFTPDTESWGPFIWLVIANLLTAALAITYWFKRSTTYPLAPALVLVSLALLAWALWWSSDAMLILTYALGSICSIWSWRQPEPSTKKSA